MSDGKRIAIKFLLPNSLTGSLIGGGGKAIKELIAETGARVNVSGATDFFPGTSDRVILISGALDEVNVAQTLVWEMIAKMNKASNEGRRDVEWSPKAALENLGENDDMEVSSRVAVPAGAGGALLGKAGSVIRSFAEESGARIVMSSKEDAIFTQERVLSISGLASECIRCLELVVNKLHDQDEISPFMNRGTSYSMNPQFGGGGRGRVVEASDNLAAVADTTITLSVPDDLVGNIFGKQGAALREIISLSGAKVTVSPRGEFVEGTNNRVVTVTGSPVATQSAHSLITQRLNMPAAGSRRR